MKQLTAMILTLAVFCLALTGAGASVQDGLAFAEANRANQDVRNSREQRLGGAVSADKAQRAEAAVFRLPVSLRTIEEEAFNGTAAVYVELPDTVERIGDRAFADMLALRNVRIPEKTTHIARNAFAGSSGVTITGAPDSYARAWAKENGIPVVQTGMLVAGNGSVQLTDLGTDRPIQISADRAAAEESGETPQWRPFSEIQSEQYGEQIASQISTRAPPACA